MNKKRRILALLASMALAVALVALAACSQPAQSSKSEEKLEANEVVESSAASTETEPFYVLLGDVLVPGNDMLPRMQAVSDAHGGASVIAVMPVPDEEVHRFGVIAGAPVPGEEGVWKIDTLVEKPAPQPGVCAMAP